MPLVRSMYAGSGKEEYTMEMAIVKRSEIKEASTFKYGLAKKHLLLFFSHPHHAFDSYGILGSLPVILTAFLGQACRQEEI